MSSQIAKDRMIAAKLGQNKYPSQQTTRIIYDTFISTNNLLGSEVTFFKNFAGKGPGATNLTQGKLDSSESMVIKNITLSLFSSSPSAPISGNFNPLGPATIDVYVGNQRVVKDMPIHLFGIRGVSNFAPYRFQGQIAFPGGPGGNSIVFNMRTLTDIVIPGDVNFSVVLKNSWSADSTTDQVCARLSMSGYGQLFNAGTSY